MPEVQGFTLRYDGEGLSDHTIDVNDLAPALMALGDLLQEGNSIANDEGSRISIKVRATNAGSFQVNLEAIRTVYEEAIPLLSGQPVTALVNLLAILGISGVAGVRSLIWLIHKLRGKMPVKVSELGTDEIEIETSGTKIRIGKLTWEMYKSRMVRKSVYGILKPLEREGIERVEFIEKAHSVVIKKDELPFFTPPEDQKELINEIPPRTTFVNVIHMWFKDGHKWKFSEGSNEWTAEITDHAFNTRLIKGEVSIHANDFLKVKVKQTQFQEGDYISSTYEIVEVLEHRRSDKQLPLI